MKGTKTCILLPKAWWPKHWAGRFRDPICQLFQALYGHPHAGEFWYEKLEAELLRLNFNIVEGRPSVFILHPDGIATVSFVVYVDDPVAIEPLKKITATKPESKQTGSECKHFARRGSVPAARLKTRSQDVPVARRKTRWSARRETRQVSAPKRAESVRQCARGKRIGARGARASERAEHARQCARSRPADPAFLPDAKCRTVSKRRNISEVKKHFKIEVSRLKQTSVQENLVPTPNTSKHSQTQKKTTEAKFSGTRRSSLKVEIHLSRPIAQEAVMHRPMQVVIPKTILVRSVAAK